MEREPITDRCPSCESRSLFVGGGGMLTCANLSCKQPAVGKAITDLKNEVSNLKQEREAMLGRLAQAVESERAGNGR